MRAATVSHSISRRQAIRRRAGVALAAALVSAFSLGALPAEAANHAAAPEAGRLSFSVVGTAAAAPEIAVISLAVEGRGETAAEALDAQAEGMNAAFNAAAALDVAPADLRTANFTLNLVNRSSSRLGSYEQREYVAANRVEITIRALDQVGEALDALVAVGVNRVDGVRFDVADRQALERAARQAAVAALEERRAFYADTAGMPVGALVELREEGGMPIVAASPALQQRAATPIAPGDVSAQISLFAVFELVRSP